MPYSRWTRTLRTRRWTACCGWSAEIRDDHSSQTVLSRTTLCKNYHMYWRTSWGIADSCSSWTSPSVPFPCKRRCARRKRGRPVDFQRPVDTVKTSFSRSRPYNNRLSSDLRADVRLQIKRNRTRTWIIIIIITVACFRHVVRQTGHVVCYQLSERQQKYVILVHPIRFPVQEQPKADHPGTGQRTSIRLRS